MHLWLLCGYGCFRTDSLNTAKIEAILIKKLTGMDTTKESPAHVLDFASFIKEYFTEYKFYAHN